MLATEKPTVAQVRDANKKFFSKPTKRWFTGRVGREKYTVVRSKDKSRWMFRIQRTRTSKSAQAFSYERTINETVWYDVKSETLELNFSQENYK